MYCMWCVTNHQHPLRANCCCAQWPRLLCIHIQRIQYLTPEVSLKRPEQVDFERELQVSSVSPYVRTLFVSSSRGSTTSTSSAAPSTTNPALPPRAASSVDATNTQPVGTEDTTATAGAELEAFVHRYRLRSLVSHLGAGADSGHYVSMRVAPSSAGSATQVPRNVARNERWLRASDTAISHISFDDVADSQAYLLFYERVSF